MRYMYKFWMASAALAILGGCAPAVPQGSIGSSSVSVPVSSESKESPSVSSAAPEESEEEPRPLYVENPVAGYEPFQEESSGLYHVIQPSPDIPYERIELRNFVEGKVLFEYLTDKVPGISGNGEYDEGAIVVYDTASKQYTTAGERWESHYEPTGVPIMMKSGYYYSSWTEDNSGRCISKVDLATGKRTAPLVLEKDYGGGIGSFTVKIDETRFLIVFDENMVIYDTRTDEIQELPAGTFEKRPVRQPDGKLYELAPIKGVDEWNFKRYDPAAGEVKDYGVVAGITYIVPGRPFQDYLSDGETVSESPFGDGHRLCWVVWKDNVPVRVLGLSLESSGGSQSWRCEEAGLNCLWKEHILYLMDSKTREIRVVDFGYREKYESMQIWFSDEGDIILIPQGQGYQVQQITFYYIPRETIDQFAVPYGEFMESK